MLPMKRPKPGETEDELFKQEKEFLEGLKARNVTPAATVVKIPKENPASSSGSSTINNQNDLHSMEDDEVEEGEAPEICHPVETVLFDIKERAFDPSQLRDFSEMKTNAQKVVRVQKDKEPSSSTGRKKSLFARSFDAKKAKEATGKGRPQQSEQRQGLSGQGARRCERSGAEIIGDKIHPYLSGMTEEEIIEEQKKLLERLDPKLVEFIKSKKYKKTTEDFSTVLLEEKPQPMEVDAKCDAKVAEEDLPINPKVVEQYPGMNKVELSKLAWTGTIKDKESQNMDTSSEKSARFDFTGMLLPHKSDDPSTYEQGLHNHGAEMERPGYTVEELLMLARSTNLQQRSIALETLGNIFARSHTGLYDEVLEHSVFNLMGYMDLIYVIRKGLDNVDSNSINATLSCLAPLVYPELEEDCLDAAFLWPNCRPHPLLSTNPEEIDNDKAYQKEIKDFEYLQLDLLDFLINRSEILVRIEYLVTSKLELFNEKGVTSLLKVLIRFARHSPNSVMKCEKILRFVTENYVSPNWMTLNSATNRNLKGIPLRHALKLVRVLVESSATNAMKLYNNYSVLPSVMSYLAYDQWREQTHVQEVEHLVLEAFKIWISFLTFGLAIDEYLALFPVLMQFLTFYGVADQFNSFDLHHSAHLFALLTQILCFGYRDKSKSEKLHSHWDLVKDTSTSIIKHSVKLLKVLSSPQLQGTYSFDLALLSLGKALEFLQRASRHDDKVLNSGSLFSVVQEFCSSTIYLQLTANLKTHSVILSKPPKKTRYPTNYITVGGTRWKGILHTIMRPNSPFHFVKHFIAFAKPLACDEDVLKVLFNQNIEKYLEALKQHTSEDCIDYFIRFELSCLQEILSILPANSSGKFEVAYRALTLVPSCCMSTIFQDLLKTALSTCCDPKDIEVVYQFYSSYFLGDFSDQIEEDASPPSKPKVRFDDGVHPGEGIEDDGSITFRKWDGKIAETHWVFHPLENLYKRVNSVPGYIDEHSAMVEQETRGCLSFIRDCLQHYKESIIRTPQDIVTVYCRICRVFMLGTPHAYIDTQTVCLLEDILKILLNANPIKSSKDLIFSKHKPSSKAAVSFFDFYTELVNEYFDNSYFNETFAAYLFLPLRAPEDINVKNCFWRHQYLNCVRLSLDRVPVPVEYLTRYPEKDPEMLTTFTNFIKRRLLTKENNPFLYEIVIKHLKNSSEFMTDQLKQDFESLRI